MIPMVGSYQIPVKVSAQGLPLETTSIRVDHHKGVKVEAQFIIQGVVTNNTQAITIPGETQKDQILILICVDLIKVRIHNNLPEDLQVVLIWEGLPEIQVN
jgi:hypothetical protein